MAMAMAMARVASAEADVGPDGSGGGEGVPRGSVDEMGEGHDVERDEVLLPLLDRVRRRLLACHFCRGVRTLLWSAACKGARGPRRSQMTGAVRSMPVCRAISATFILSQFPLAASFVMNMDCLSPGRGTQVMQYCSAESETSCICFFRLVGIQPRFTRSGSKSAPFVGTNGVIMK